MSIIFSCPCGQQLRAPDERAGLRVRCPSCGEFPIVPGPMSMAPALQSATRNYRYWILLLVLAPLAWTTFRDAKSPPTSLDQRIKQSIVHHPEVRDQLEVLPDDASESQFLNTLFDALPAHKLDGALLPWHTRQHWELAALAAIVYLAVILLIFPVARSSPHYLLGIGLITGTAGIFLLLGFQWLAFHMPLFRGSGYLTILLDLVWLIGQSYSMALGDHGFILSFLGFTAGVGFCEEVCKALPVVLKARATGFADWRNAMVWGMVSGVGFGVSEGITYSAEYYNGFSGPDMYWVRFVSCVGLHAIWAGAVGITVFRNQNLFRGRLHPLEWVWRLAQVVIVPMLLHGAYDTLLKQKADMYALTVAVLSFGWFAFQIERAARLPSAEQQHLSASTPLPDDGQRFM